MNRTTELLYYNQRLILDNNILTEPRTWQISKIDRIISNGLSIFTCAQNMFDEHKDYIELDKYGNVIGMWADYWESNITPISPDNPVISNIYSEITYSGVKPQLKVGGNYKKFTVTFYDKDAVIPYREGVWSYTIDGVDASDLVTMPDSSSDTEENQIKIKFTGNKTYIGKVMTITHTSNTIVSSIDIEIVGL